LDAGADGHRLAGAQASRFRLPPLHSLPVAWRALLTVVVIFIGAGYFAALVNVLAQNELVDGQPGLSAADLILKYAGKQVPVVAGKAPPSRMLEMIRTAMREYFDSDDDFRVLERWLTAGASREAFTSGPEPTPHDVVLTTCLRCHAADSRKEIGRKSPFGPDQFTVDYEWVSKFTLAPPPGATSVWRPPRDWRDLALTTHAHMLSVPVFVVLLGALFLCSGWPQGESRAAAVWRTVLACAPLVLFLADVACWWLARLPGVGWVFALTIGATGVLFGVAFGLQWIVVIGALWSMQSSKTNGGK